MSATLLDHVEIARRLPHSGTMCLLDALHFCSEDEIHCSAIGHADLNNPMRSAAALQAACGIEYAAQAMALHGALLGEATREGTDAPWSEPLQGFLASVRNVRFNTDRLDTYAGPLQVRAQRLSGDARQVLYSFNVSASPHAVLLEGRAVVVLDTRPLHPSTSP